MRKKLAIGITCMFLMSTYSVFVGAEQETENEQINVRYSFVTPKLTKVTISGIVYDQVTLNGVPCFGNPGEPYLPMKGAYILLPQGSKVNNVIIETGEKIYLGSSYNILPVGKPIPLSKISSVSYPVPDESIYSSSDMYPGELFSEVGTYSFRGYDILVLTLYPVQYVPLDGELFYYPDLKVTVETVEDYNTNQLFRGLSQDKIEVLNKVDNPVVADTYSDLIVASEASDYYDLLILTTDEFRDDFEPLKNAHESNGMLTRIKTLSDIALSPDRVTSEDIRSFIRDEYLNQGIEYLLIGGDADIIHDKLLYVYGYDEDMPNRFYDDMMPVDMYYGCLDGTFNYDDDDKWGERTDGENGGDVDLIAEVYVGRACVDNVFDINNFVTKTIDYMNTGFSDEYLKKNWMVGERLGNHGVASWGGNYLDLLIDGSDLDGYTTVGISTSKYDIGTLYDRDLPDYWSTEEIIEIINEGIHILNHDGHSYYNYNMRMTNDDVERFTNDQYCFAYSVGCMAGGFDDPDGYDCFAEYMTVKTKNGAFAGIWNARYGWFWSQRLDGDSTRYTREFWDAVFGEHIPVISKANQDSKEDNLYLIERSCMRWTYYQLNLFGDPAVAFHVGNPPDKPNKPIGPTSGKPEQEYTYSSSTSDPDGDQVYYLWNWDDGTDSGWIGPYNSGESCEALHEWYSKEDYQVKIKAKDTNGMESGWSEPLSVNLPKNRNKFIFSNLLFLRSMKHFLRNFPMLKNILER